MEHSDLVAEISVVEKMSPVERLVHARKRRAYQLKQYRRYEKKIDKESTKRKKPNTYSGSKRPPKYLKKSSGVDFANNIKLLEAAARNDIDEVHSLLLNDVSPDLTNEDGLTALHQCCIDESKKLMQVLLDFGANINARDSELWTPMHAAATCGHIRLCEILINHNADLLAVNADGNMPYDICDDEETLDLIENEMAKRGITQEQIDETREAKERQMFYDLLQYVKQGADLRDIADYNGVTPLHIAAANGYIEVAKYLLDHKVPVNTRDDESWEPIHAAACWQEALMLDLLVEYGADINSKTKKNDTPFDICDDPDIKQKILDMKDEQEYQKRKCSGSVRKTSRPNNRSASLRRSSMRGEKSALFMKEAKEEAAHFGVINLDSSNDIAEEEDDDEDEEDDDLPVTSVDDVELIMDDMKESNISKLPESASQKSYQNGDTTNERNRLKSSDSFHSKISEVLLMTQKPKSWELNTPGVTPSLKTPGVITSSRTPDVTPSSRTPDVTPSSRTPDVTPSSRTPDVTPSSSTPAVTSLSRTPAVTSPSSTASVNFPHETRVIDSKKSIDNGKSSKRDSKKPTSLETNIDYPVKRSGPTSPDVSALAMKFNLMSSNTNGTKPLETVLGRPVLNPGSNSNRSSKTSVKENRNPSEDVSPHTKNTNNYNTAVSQTTESSSNKNRLAPVNTPSSDSLQQQSNNKLVNGSNSNEKSRALSPSTKTVAPVKPPTTSVTANVSSKTPAPSNMPQYMKPIPARRSVAPKTSDLSTPGLNNSRLKDKQSGGSNSKSDPVSTKTSNYIMTSSTSRPVDVRTPSRNVMDNTPTDKDNGNAEFEREMDNRESMNKQETGSKSVNVEGEKLPANIPYDLDNTSSPAPTPSDSENTTAGIRGIPQLDQPRYPTNRAGGCTLSDLKRQRQANYNRRGSTGSGASSEKLTPAGENIKNLPGNSNSVQNSPGLSSKITTHTPTSATTPATIGNYSPWTSSMSNGNDTVPKYSAPSTVQVVGGQEKKCCCVII